MICNQWEAGVLIFLQYSPCRSTSANRCICERVHLCIFCFHHLSGQRCLSIGDLVRNGLEVWFLDKMASKSQARGSSWDPRRCRIVERTRQQSIANYRGYSINASLLKTLELFQHTPNTSNANYLVLQSMLVQHLPVPTVPTFTVRRHEELAA